MSELFDERQFINPQDDFNADIVKERLLTPTKFKRGDDDVLAMQEEALSLFEKGDEDIGGCYVDLILDASSLKMPDLGEWYWKEYRSFLVRKRSNASGFQQRMLVTRIRETQARVREEQGPPKKEQRGGLI